MLGGELDLNKFEINNYSEDKKNYFIEEADVAKKANPATYHIIIKFVLTEELRNLLLALTNAKDNDFQFVIGTAFLRGQVDDFERGDLFIVASKFLTNSNFYYEQLIETTNDSLWVSFYTTQYFAKLIGVSNTPATPYYKIEARDYPVLNFSIPVGDHYLNLIPLTEKWWPNYVFYENIKRTYLDNGVIKIEATYYSNFLLDEFLKSVELIK